MPETTDDFPALFKRITAMLGIETHLVTDAFGRPTVALDRPGMERLRAAAVEHGFPELVDGIDRMLAEGGLRISPPSA